MRSFLSSLFLAGLIVAAGLTLTSCATIRGAGEDVQSIGRGVERTVDNLSR